MQLKLRPIAICAIISLSLFAGKANAEIKLPTTDSTCCKPDSLKVVSLNYPAFCVSWWFPEDSACVIPYGFEVQWRALGTHFYAGGTKFYVSGGTQIFCDNVYSCRTHEWRVRTICTSGGVTTYSDWVYGPYLYFCPDALTDRKDGDGIEKQDLPQKNSLLPAGGSMIVLAQTGKTKRGILKNNK